MADRDNRARGARRGSIWEEVAMLKNARWIYVVGLAVLVMLMGPVGCEPGGYFQPDVSGVWDWTTPRGAEGVLELTQSGNEVTGTMIIMPVNYIKWPVTGTVNGYNVQFTVKLATFTIDMRGTVVADWMRGPLTTSTDRAGPWSAARR